jgi:3-oxoacyl-[acyl-carrier protein] reductase
MKVIVTGASQGIGHGIAQVLAEAGHAVGLLARSDKLLQNLAEDIRAQDGTAHVATCDLRDPEETTRAINSLMEQLQGLDALINNAGVVIRKNIFDLTPEEWETMVQTNINGLFYATRAVLPTLRAQGAGHIINISSISGKLPLPGGSAYAATKFAVTGFSQSLFLELRDHGIKVTTVYPGSVDSNSHRHDPNQDHTWKVTPREVGEACRAALETRSENCFSDIGIRPARRPQAG